MPNIQANFLEYISTVSLNSKNSEKGIKRKNNIFWAVQWE